MTSSMARHIRAENSPTTTGLPKLVGLRSASPLRVLAQSGDGGLAIGSSRSRSICGLGSRGLLQ